MRLAVGCPDVWGHMAIEIERKFCVIGNAWRDGVTRMRRLPQAYLTKNGRISIRVRIDGDASATLTIKTASSGIERDEYEYSIPVRDALELFEHREGSVVVKVRHIVPIDGLEWEIDVFEGENAGLVIAEVELPSADTRFALPPWLGQEVTQDRRYYNADLARHPYAFWSTNDRVAQAPALRSIPADVGLHLAGEPGR